MTEGINALCAMEVFNEFSDEVDAKIQRELHRRHNGCVTVELTAYADYCLKLLQNNGLNIERDADEIFLFMWRACPAGLLTIAGYPDCRGQWDMRNGACYLNIYL